MKWTKMLVATVVILAVVVIVRAVFFGQGERILVPIMEEVIVDNSSPVADDVLEGVSLEEMVGQLFMVGHWAGAPVASTTALIREYHIGSVIIMSAPEDPNEIKEWVNEWNEASEESLLIAIDQEGGPVSRLKGEGFIQTGQRDIKTAEEAYELGRRRAVELSTLGINMNFAPVLDAALNPDSFMYSRVFQKQEDTPVLADAMLRGFLESGVVGVPKHFPGHDDTSEDSHAVLPTVSIARAELDTFTTPFRKLIEGYEPRAIMTAHVLFSKIDDVPATLSHFFLTDYLRDELGFQGVIITDGMSMDAIDEKWGAEQGAVMALRAGADMVLFAAEPERTKGAVKEVLHAIEGGSLPKETIVEHYARVSKLLPQEQ